MNRFDGAPCREFEFSITRYGALKEGVLGGWVRTRKGQDKYRLVVIVGVAGLVAKKLLVVGREDT